MTPVKYECDSGNLTGTFATPKILLTEKLANGALVTPTPDLHVSYNNIFLLVCFIVLLILTVLHACTQVDEINSGTTIHVVCPR